MNSQSQDKHRKIDNFSSIDVNQSINLLFNKEPHTTSHANSQTLSNPSMQHSQNSQKRESIIGANQSIRNLPNLSNSFLKQSNYNAVIQKQKSWKNPKPQKLYQTFKYDSDKFKMSTYSSKNQQNQQVNTTGNKLTVVETTSSCNKSSHGDGQQNSLSQSQVNFNIKNKLTQSNSSFFDYKRKASHQSSVQNVRTPKVKDSSSVLMRAYHNIAQTKKLLAERKVKSSDRLNKRPNISISENPIILTEMAEGIKSSENVSSTGNQSPNEENTITVEENQFKIGRQLTHTVTQTYQSPMKEEQSSFMSQNLMVRYEDSAKNLNFNLIDQHNNISNMGNLGLIEYQSAERLRKNNNFGIEDKKSSQKSQSTRKRWNIPKKSHEECEVDLNTDEFDIIKNMDAQGMFGSITSLRQVTQTPQLSKPLNHIQHYGEQ
ncbi:UNKNOWN [Stylonychia lemnae]|uniref:Uncharacterized protein n=1 Tax=Stylonychia lemnae TaxID=5949 RepID=A0A078ADZ3_STYLE|nr:UNKNOWN [Stylonychia lemnae]|eukprot:CDW80425.1 UNKNOWN [Stylonychia lemnae]